MQSKATVESVLGASGILSTELDGYEVRPQQMQMSQAVEKALANKKRLIVEAATGTGKTLAYLIPALLSGKRVVVSTATKALQEQIAQKDVPLLKKALRKLDKPVFFKAVVLKGRTNYLCQLRFDAIDQITLRHRADTRHIRAIKAWEKKTTVGDRAEIKGLPDDFAPWTQLSATGQQCLGKDCNHYEDCYVMNARREAASANLIITNHHLFFADLAMRDQASNASLLPDYDVVIFDEAHHLETTLTQHFGTAVSNWRFAELVGDITRAMEDAQALSKLGRDYLAEVEDESRRFFKALAIPDGRHALEDVLKGKEDAVKDALKELSISLDNLREWVKTANAGEVGARLAERCSEVAWETTFCTRREEKGYVYLCESRGSGTYLEAAPIDVGKIFRTRVLNSDKNYILTSATLTTGGNFDFFCKRLGMWDRDDIETLELSSVFDYEERAVVYVPRRLPQPHDRAFIPGVAQIVEYLVNLTLGRAFVLFTSYRNMDAVYHEVAEKLPYQVLRQGDAPKTELLATFKKDKSSVLFATASFWEGVDVEGDALMLVIIDKLPFPNPSDPLNKARMERIDAQGGSSFASFTLPSAAITLKQGFGRLIRSTKDQGVVAILDSRIAHKRYGSTFLKSLPPAPVVWNARDVKAWWKAKVSP